MSEFHQTATDRGKNAERNSQHEKHGSAHHLPPATHNPNRLAELESENSRLHRLVAELLIKNQQLRKPD